jgi:5-methyltetrahydrofolate--homocysteine methyltransferase
MDLYKPFGPFQVIVMASERTEDGIAKRTRPPTKSPRRKRAAMRLQNDYGMALDDVYIDVSVSAVVADTNGLHRATLEAVHMRIPIRSSRACTSWAA